MRSKRYARSKSEHDETRRPKTPEASRAIVHIAPTIIRVIALSLDASACDVHPVMASSPIMQGPT